MTQLLDPRAADRLAPDEGPSLVLTVGNEMVRLYKETLGRGPTKTWVTWAGPDTLVCTLRETFTRAEATLTAMGEGDRVREARLFLHRATEQTFTDAIARTVGRSVAAFTSGLDARQDIVTAVFYFDPQE